MSAGLLPASAVAMLGRSEWRRRRSSLVVIGLMSLLVSSVVLATLSGAQRTRTALDRHLAQVDAPDGEFGFFYPAVANDPAVAADLVDGVRAINGVEQVDAQVMITAQVDGGGYIGLIAGEDNRYIERLGPELVAGRLPASDAADELLVLESTRDGLGVELGDRVSVATYSAATMETILETNAWDQLDGPVLSMTVVGVVRRAEDLAASRDELLVAFAGPALAPQFPEIGQNGLRLRVFTGNATVDDAAVLDAIGSVVPPEALLFGTFESAQIASVRTATDTLANGLLLFAAVAVVAGLLAIAMAVGRHLDSARSDAAAVQALGVSAKAVSASQAVPVAMVVLLGVVGGAVAAVALSPLFPISIARRAELADGLWWSPLLLVTSTALVAIIGMAVVAAQAARQGRRASARDVGCARVRRPFGARWRPLLPVPAAIGVSVTVDRPRGAVSATAAWCAAALAAVGAVAVLTVLTSSAAANDDPTLWGVSWDAEPDFEVGDLDLPIPEYLAGVADDPQVADAGGLLCQPSPVATIGRVCTVFSSTGVMTGVVSSGRLPVADDELAIGSRTAGELGVGIGDEIAAPGPEGSVTYRVVGIGVLPPRLDSTSGTGAWGTVGGVLAAGEVDVADGLDSQTLIRFEDAADGPRREQTIQALEQRYPALSFGTDQMAMTPERLGQMDRIRTLLLVLVGFVGVIGAIGVMHYLVLSVGRRRRETAVLRAIGFVRAQARAVVAWQAVVVAVIGSLIGVPIGFLIGRWAWEALLVDSGVIATASPSALVLVGVPAVVILGAVALAAVPAWASVRRHPSAGLREQ